jgi:hypothetical protein
MKYLLPLLFAGCGIHVAALDVTAGTVDYMQEVRKTRRNYTSGNQSDIKADHQNLVYEDEEYIQLKNEPSRLPQVD